MMSRSPVHDDGMRNIHNQKRECKIDESMPTERQERNSDTNWKHFDPSCPFHSLQGLCACESRHATKDLHPELGKTTEHNAVKMKNARQTKAGQDPGHIPRQVCQNHAQIFTQTDQSQQSPHHGATGRLTANTLDVDMPFLNGLILRAPKRSVMQTRSQTHSVDMGALVTLCRVRLDSTASSRAAHSVVSTCPWNLRSSWVSKTSLVVGA